MEGIDNLCHFTATLGTVVIAMAGGRMVLTPPKKATPSRRAIRFALMTLATSIAVMAPGYALNRLLPHDPPPGSLYIRLFGATEPGIMSGIMAFLCLSTYGAWRIILWGEGERRRILCLPDRSRRARRLDRLPDAREGGLEGHPLPHPGEAPAQIHDAMAMNRGDEGARKTG